MKTPYIRGNSAPHDDTRQPDHTVASRLVVWQTPDVLIADAGSFDTRAAERSQSMRGNAWMESGRVDSREVCGWFCCWWVRCVKACHTKPKQKYILCKLSGCFLNTESASLPDQRRSRRHRQCPGSHTHVSHTLSQPWCARLYGSFVFMLLYVFRLHGFFVLSKLNTRAIIHDASEEPVQQQKTAVMSAGLLQGCSCWQYWTSLEQTLHFNHFHCHL